MSSILNDAKDMGKVGKIVVIGYDFEARQITAEYQSSGSSC